MNHRSAPLASLAGLALDAVIKLLTAADTPPSVRLRAAKLILDVTADHYTEPADPEIPSPETNGDDPVAASAAPEHDTPAQLSRQQPKIGRNDYCPCGSGLKFKKCCLEKSNQTTRLVALPREGPPLVVA